MQKGSKNSQYKFSQVFGYKNSTDKIQEEDIISALRFDKTGRFLSLGDNAGRIIIFQNLESKKKTESFEYYAEFQSHIRQFDPLNSMDVQQSIKDICWLNAQGKYLKLLTTNSKCIKMWKVFEKTQKKVTKSAGKELNMPKIQPIQSSLVANQQKCFPLQHVSSINSLSTSNNEQYVLSSDDVQIFLWGIQKAQKPYMVVDMKQKLKIQDVKQTITCSKFHPVSDSLLVYGTNKGTLKMGDLRTSAICDKGVSFISPSQGNKNFFTEMISSYSSAQFLNNTRQIISRDYLSIKIWDIANPSKPINTITIQDSLKGKLCQMFENDSIFDKFNMFSSQDSSTILTGNYNNSFHLIDAASGSNMQYQLSYKKNTIVKQIVPNKLTTIAKMDYEKKSTALDYHPLKHTVAIASLNCFFIYTI